LTTAIRTGVRHAANNRHLRATLMRTLAFFTFASAYFALLPLVARDQLTQGPSFTASSLARSADRSFWPG
jgi:Transmembrane secretion effector